MKVTEQLRSNNASFWLFGICCFMFGMVAGFFLAPIKKGFRIGCDNTITNTECANNNSAEADKMPKRSNKKIDDIDIKI